MTYLFPIVDPVATAARVKAAGGPTIDSTQPTGDAVAHGVHLGWVISEGIITISVVSKPWYVSESQITDALEGFFGGAA